MSEIRTSIQMCVSIKYELKLYVLCKISPLIKKKQTSMNTTEQNIIQQTYTHTHTQQ